MLINVISDINKLKVELGMSFYYLEKTNFNFC